MDRVIFACPRSAGGAQMAAAIFNRTADPSRARAHAARTTPAATIQPEIADAMREVGLDLSTTETQMLTPELATGARLLITMGGGQEFPDVPGLEVEEWALDDPKGKLIEGVREIRDQIERRVKDLVTARRWRSDR